MENQASGATYPQHKSLSLLEEGILLAQRNEREAARTILGRVIQNEPESEDAWLWLAWLADDKDGCLLLLREAKQILPNSQRLKEAIASVVGDTAPAQPLTEVEAVNRTTPKIAKPSSKPAREPQASIRRKRAPTRPVSEPSDFRNPAKPTDEPHAPKKSVRRWQLPVAGLSALGLVALVIIFAITGALNPDRIPTVHAYALPTAIVDATPTVNPLDLTAPLFAEVDSAMANQDWALAIDLLQRIRLITPDDERARQLLAKAHYERGNLEILANVLDQAQFDLDEAIRLDASDLKLHDTRRILTLYLDGVRAYSLQNWDEVVRCLGKVYKSSTGFRDTQVMLAQGYLGVARAQQTNQDWIAAQKSLENALQLKPDFAEAQQVMIEVQDAITPPRRIEVSLTEHVVRAYENHQVIRTFPMCDGKKGSPTRAGRFQVLDKLPLALASQWGGLQMPWWIGLYYTNDDAVNGIENGFHALPFRADQQVMWANSLGGECSYGCLVLDTQDAIWLYNWVEIGTVVFINE